MNNNDSPDITIEEAQLKVDSTLKEYEADRQNKEKLKAYKNALDEYQTISAKALR